MDKEKRAHKLYSHWPTQMEMSNYNEIIQITLEHF